MNKEQLRDLIVTVLEEIAPDIDGHRLDPAVSFKEQFDLDSIDQLNFVVTLCKRLGVEIDQKDYGRLEDLTGCFQVLGVRS